VLSFQGNLERGEAIFAVNCAGCHGIKGDGDVGPSLHNISKNKSETSIINQVISGKTPPMPKFQPSAQDMADLLSYLHQLSDSN
jgi:mono/diheme cytochrome c family protein